MEEVQKGFTVENLISCWNEQFEDHHLTLAGLTNPQELIGAALIIFNRIGYDTESIMSLPPEEHRNNHLIYYQDLLPIINTTRCFNHLVSVMSEVYAISISNFLQPTASMSYSMLMLLFNLMLFNDDRLSKIAPSEEELFNRNGQLKILEDKKNSLLEMLNEQIQNKCKRPEKLEKVKQSIIQIKEELKLEREGNTENKQQCESQIAENRQLEMLSEQKKTQRDTEMGEVERLKAMRVYDADDIEAQRKQALQHVEESEKKLCSLGETLTEKENCLKNLQTTKHHLSSSLSLLDDVMKQTECLKEFESPDLESESKEGELEVLQTALKEDEVALAELISIRKDAARTRQQEQADRQLAKTKSHSALRVAEENEVKLRELSNRNLQRNQELKELTGKYEEAMEKGMAELDKIKNNFCNELKISEDILLKKVADVKRQIEEKIRSRAS